MRRSAELALRAARAATAKAEAEFKLRIAEENEAKAAQELMLAETDEQDLQGFEVPTVNVARPAGLPPLTTLPPVAKHAYFGNLFLPKTMQPPPPPPRPPTLTQNVLEAYDRFYTPPGPNTQDVDLLGLQTARDATAALAKAQEVILTPQQIALLAQNRAKEIDVLNFGEMPSPPQLKAFERVYRQTVASASGGFYDLAYAWANETKQKTFEQLGDPGSFPNLDGKIGVACSKMFRGDLQRRVNLVSDKMDKEGKILRGRQMMKMMFVKLEPEAAACVSEAQKNLTAIMITTLDQLEGYLTNLDTIVSTCPADIPLPLLESYLLSQMEKFDEFKIDIGEYERSEPHLKRNFEFLRERADAYLERKRKKNVHSSLAGAYKGKAPQPTPTSALFGASVAKSPGSPKKDERSKGRAPSPPGVPNSQKACFSMRDSKACAKGSSCEYSHDEKILEESKKNKRSPTPPRGSPGKAAPTPLTPRSRPTTCKAWKVDGKCKFEDKCAWQHPDAEKGVGLCAIEVDLACTGLDMTTVSRCLTSELVEIDPSTKKSRKLETSFSAKLPEILSFEVSEKEWHGQKLQFLDVPTVMHDRNYSHPHYYKADKEANDKNERIAQGVADRLFLEMNPNVVPQTDAACIGLSSGDPAGDSGAGHHLWGLAKVPKEFLKEVYEGTLVLLSTANGILRITKRIDWYLPQLELKLTFLLLPDSPMAISLGRLLADQDWNMFWKGKNDPVIVDNDMKPKAKFKLHRNVPYFQMKDPEQSMIGPEQFELLNELAVENSFNYDAAIPAVEEKQLTEAEATPGPEAPIDAIAQGSEAAEKDDVFWDDFGEPYFARRRCPVGGAREAADTLAIPSEPLKHETMAHLMLHNKKI